ncbi:MAG: hypothetical protein OEN02_19935, partial [Gammaproteobacteria bacterium]|nr:hypothetical protein [Gammaproteobacteria bacterium]
PSIKPFGQALNPVVIFESGAVNCTPDYTTSSIDNSLRLLEINGIAAIRGVAANWGATRGDDRGPG